jgi:EmrB/QacA subfamily drug resistance transporter
MSMRTLHDSLQDPLDAAAGDVTAVAHFDGSDLGHPRRWAILAVLSLSLFITVLDGTIVNVALPSLSVELGASTRQLQWIVDSYLLVFTGLLLAAGGLGDRYGRKRMLMLGLVTFGVTSAIAGDAGSANALIASRALMGIGAALIFPATLAILTDVFRNPSERAKAIGIWSAVSGMAVAFGPITGGWLLENFWWGSIFYVNLPVVVIAVFAAWILIPESREQDAPALDKAGIVLSIAAIGTLVFTIIEAPEWGWLSLTTLGGFALAAVLLTAFIAVELRHPHPMLPVGIFANLRFSAASVAVTAAFFALFGFIFLITQYFQLVLGYGPFEAGLRTLPVAGAIAGGSVAAPMLVNRFGTTQIVRTGLGLMATSFLWISLRADVDTAYIEIAGQMVLLGLGLGFTTAPATESIMGSLSSDKAGVGSAVNDTTRELGGTLGVAIIGSVFSSLYASSLHSGNAAFDRLPEEMRLLTEESVGAARIIAAELGPNAGPYLDHVNQAFLSGLSAGTLVAAGVAAAGAIFASKFLPAQAT